MPFNTFLILNSIFLAGSMSFHEAIYALGRIFLSVANKLSLKYPSTTESACVPI